MYKLIIVLAANIFSSGCVYTVSEVASPPQITVNEAMRDIGDGLNTLRLKTGGKYGLLVDEVTVDFNISAKATSDGKLGITTEKIPIVTSGILGANASAALASEANRGNKISIKLKNIATADLKGDKSLIEKCKKNPADCGVLFSLEPTIQSQ